MPLRPTVRPAVSAYIAEVVAMQDGDGNQAYRDGYEQYVPVYPEGTYVRGPYGRQQGVCRKNHEVAQGIVFQKRIKDRTKHAAEPDVQKRHPRPKPQADTQCHRYRKQSYGIS